MKRKKMKQFKKKKGFTLVEMVITLVILVAIGLVIGTNLNRLSNRQSEENYEVFKNRVTSAADIYLNQHTTRLNDLFIDRGYLVVTLGELKTAGLIDNNLINPETGDIVGDSEQVKVSLDAAGLIQYVYPVDPNEINEEYLQALNVYLELGEPATCTTRRPSNDFELGLVKTDGSLDTNISNITSAIVSCDWNNNNRNTVGTHVVTYIYTTSTGVQKTTTRNFIVMPALTYSIAGVPAASGTATNGNEWWNQSFSISLETNRHANITYSWSRYRLPNTCSGDNACTSNDLTPAQTTGTLAASHIIEGEHWYRVDYTVWQYNNPSIPVENGKGHQLVLLRIDRTTPNCIVSGGNPAPAAWINLASNPGTITITGTCSERQNASNSTAGSGCRPNNDGGFISYVFRDDQNNSTRGPGSDGGAGQIRDNAGNVGACPANQTVRIDRTAPTCTVSGGNSSWINMNSNPGSVTIVGICTNGSISGCPATNIVGTGRVERTFSTDMNVTNGVGPGSGNNGANGSIQDMAGNPATCPLNQTVKIDKTRPNSPTISRNGTNVQITANGDAGTAGIASGIGSSPIRFCTGSSGCTPSSTYSTPQSINAIGTYYFRALVNDNASNQSNITSQSFTVTSACPSPYVWDGTTCRDTQNNATSRQEYNCPSNYTPQSWTTSSPYTCTESTSSRDSRSIYGCSSPYSPTYESTSTYSCTETIARPTSTSTCTNNTYKCSNGSCGNGDDYYCINQANNRGCSYSYNGCSNGSSCSSTSTSTCTNSTYRCNGSGSCTGNDYYCANIASSRGCSLSGQTRHTTNCSLTSTSSCGYWTATMTCTSNINSGSTCRTCTATLTCPANCPSGYTLSGSQCTRSRTSPLKRTEYQCPSGWSPQGWSTSVSSCTRTTSTRQSRTTYSCPSGFNGSGNWSTTRPSSCTRTTSPVCSGGTTRVGGLCFTG